MLELENFFLRSWNWFSSAKEPSSAVLVCFNYVMNIVKVKWHILCNFPFSPSRNPFSVLILKHIKRIVKWSEIPTSPTDENVLLYFKIDHGDINCTLAVIKFDISVSNFIVVENILWEMNLETHRSFTSAHGVQWEISSLDLVRLEGNWVFMDHQQILVSNESFIVVMNFCHDGVSNLHFWLSAIILSLPVATSWSPSWKDELKWNSVISGSERFIELEAVLSKLKELFSKLNFDIFNDLVTKCIHSDNLIPVTSLFFSFNVEL